MTGMTCHDTLIDLIPTDANLDLLLWPAGCKLHSMSSSSSVADRSASSYYYLASFLSCMSLNL
jgi:hypothetical protein